MKIAKPTNEDINAAINLICAAKNIIDGYHPSKTDDYGDPAELDDDERGEALEYVAELYDQSNIEWLLIALGSVIAPENGIINQESDTLELAADLVQGQQDTDRLNWLIANGADIQNQNGYHQLSIDPDCNPDLVGNQEGIRAAIDKRLAEWCPTMNRPKKHCNCPDCGSSLVQIGN